MGTEFREEQKFTQWWLWIILLGIAAIPLFGIYKQLIRGGKFGNNPVPDLVLIIFTVLTLAILLLLWSMKLTTKINRHEIGCKFFPFAGKRISWREVKSAEVVNYGFVGGWGIRLGTKYGTVYNVKGNKGLAIELHNGKKFLIGTQKETQLNHFLSELKKRPLE